MSDSRSEGREKSNNDEMMMDDTSQGVSALQQYWRQCTAVFVAAVSRA